MGMSWTKGRYYDPQTGRFVNADGLVDTGTGLLGANMFAYCNNNPVNMSDPSGMCFYFNNVKVLSCSNPLCLLYEMINEFNRIKNEATKQVEQAAAAQAAAEAKKNAKAWPAPSTTITSGYGMRTHPITKKQTMHNGIDIAPLAYRKDGDPIYAAISGKVKIVNSISKGNAGIYMQVVSWDNITVTQYMHLSEIVAHDGQEVAAGDIIAKMGTTGGSTGTHLHFGVLVNGSYVNPRNWGGWIK